MANQLHIKVDNPTELLNAGAYGTGALIQIQSSATETGTYADLTGTGSTPTIALVAADTAYTGYDPAGTSSTWYRTRYKNAAGSLTSDWSAVFQVGALSAYASLDDLREYLSLPDNSRDNLLSDLLSDASDYISARIGHDFYRHPQVTGTEVRTFDGSGSSEIRVRAGIVSLTQVELATYTGGTFTILASTDWFLEPIDKADDFSYSEVVLSNMGAYRYWYPGYATARLTGVFGWASVPAMIRKATLDLAREWYRQGPGGGGPVGVTAFGTPIFGGGEPKSVRDAVEHYGPALVA